jgi:hypothetical protein
MSTRETARRDAARLGELRKALCDAIDRNLPVLASLAGLPDNAIMHDSGLETAIWDVWKGDVVQLVKDPVLRGDLALFFERLERIDRLNLGLVRLYTSADAALSGSTDTRVHVRRLLARNASSALQGGQEVRVRLAHGS